MEFNEKYLEKWFQDHPVENKLTKKSLGLLSIFSSIEMAREFGKFWSDFQPDVLVYLKKMNRR